MSFPRPVPGLVIRYAYLWAREARAGREEGVKDRPCAVVLVTSGQDDRAIVTVLPVTHTPPADPRTAIELPPRIKAHLGLDGHRSWVVLTEYNAFAWPGPDLRPGTPGAPESVAYGMLPPGFFRRLRNQLLDLARVQRPTPVTRT